MTKIRQHSSTVILMTSYRKNWTLPPTLPPMSSPNPDRPLPINRFNHFIPKISSWKNCHTLIPQTSLCSESKTYQKNLMFYLEINAIGKRWRLSATGRAVIFLFRTRGQNGPQPFHRPCSSRGTQTVMCPFAFLPTDYDT